jgi:PiT family inorganic phosphate transporter
VLAFLAAGMAILIAYRMVGRLRPGPVNRGYRYGQIASLSLLSLSHGTNDAQKTMGIITLALVANGSLTGVNPDPPTWVIVSAASAIALGTYSGGWRIIRTMGSRIIKMDPAQGFSAQTGGAAVILTAAHLGFPLSTTHSITGAVLGAGAAKRVSAVRWGLAGNIFLAWVLTLPCAAAVGGLTYGVTRIFGTGALGPLLVSVALLALMAVVFGKRLQRGPALTTAVES